MPDLQVWDGDLNVMNRIHCNFMLALGYKGLALADGNAEDECRSLRYLSEAEKLDINHLGIAEFKLVMGI